MKSGDLRDMLWCCHCHSSERFEEWQDGTRQCQNCHSTIVYSVEEMLNLLQMLHDEGILQSVDEHEIEIEMYGDDYDD